MATKDIQAQGVLDGGVVHKLKETYGFPPDLTAVLLKERGLASLKKK